MMNDFKNTYLILSSKNKKNNAYLAISQNIPIKNEPFVCKRLMYYYGGVYEDSITTSKVKQVKKITDDIYKIKTNHVYFVKVERDS